MIRRAEKADRELVASLFREFYASDAVAYRVSGRNHSLTFEEAMRSDEYVEIYLVFEDELPMGYAQVSKTFSHEAGGLVVWLEEIYLRPEFRGRGLGGRLLDFILNRFSAAAAIRLEVEPENARAARLYEKYGFARMPYFSMLRLNGTECVLKSSHLEPEQAE